MDFLWAMVDAAIISVLVLTVSEAFHPHTEPVFCTENDVEAKAVAAEMKNAGFGAAVVHNAGQYFVTVPRWQSDEALDFIPF